MSVPDREKISEQITKQWEVLDDETIIKDVATKGKYLNLCLHFLSRRNNNKSIQEARDYFNTEVDKYVHRLLANRQVHKAELVLSNIGRESQIIFYEFVQSTSKEHIDEQIKEYVLDHIQKCNKTFERDRDEYDYYLLVLRLVIGNRKLRQTYESKIPEFTLESLYRLDEEFRQKLAIATCIQCKNAALVERLDRRTTWEYLLRNDEFLYLAKWLDLCYENKKIGSPDAKYTKKEITYDVAIRNQFSSWDIEMDMFDMVNDIVVEAKFKDFLLNSLAKNGYFITRERDDILKRIYRVLTTESFQHNEKWLNTVPNLFRILHIVCDNDELGLLCEKIFTEDVLVDVAVDYPRFKKEIDLSVTIKDTNLNDPQQLAQFSATISKYIADSSDTDFYQKMPFIYFTEYLLRNGDVQEFIGSDDAKAIMSKAPFLDAFLQKLSTKTTYADYDVTLSDLLQSKNIDLSIVRSDAQPTPDVAEMVSFANVSLSQKYAQPTTLGYVHYIKQHRSSYAVYQFFLDQLQNYSQISRAQIQVICSAVSELAVNSLGDRVLITHCLAFMEMLGVSTQVLRAYLKCLQIIRGDGGNATVPEYEVLARAEEILLKKLHANSCQVEPCQMEAMRIMVRSRNVDMPIEFLKCVASDSNWFHFMLFASFYNYSIRSMINVCQMNCFRNRNIGLNVGRALKEIIIEDEMPAAKRTSSFSYREHKKKHSKSEGAHMLNASSNRILSASISVIESAPTKFISSQYLNINDDRDIFAIILLCTVDGGPPREATLNVKLLKEIMKSPDQQQTATYLNLLRLAFKLKWPLLTVVATMSNDMTRDYCWAAWLIISMGMPAISGELKTLEQLSRMLITYAVNANYVRTLHQSIQIFYPESYFCMFTSYLSATSFYDFSFDVTKSMQTYLTELNQNNVTLSCLTNYHRDEMLEFTIGLLIDFVARSFDSLEHRQLLLKSLCAAGISDYTTTIDFCTIKTISKIINFTSVQLNVRALMRTPSVPDLDTATANNNHLDEEGLQTEYQRLIDALITDKQFKKAMELADLLALPKDTIVYECWVHSFETNPDFCLTSCEEEIEELSLSPLLLMNFLILVAHKLHYSDPKKYQILKKILDSIKKHHLHPSENINRDRIEYDLVMCILRNSRPIKSEDIYHSEYYEAVLVAERNVLYKSFINLKQTSGVDELNVFNREPLSSYELGRLEELMNKILDKGDIVQALRLQAMFNHRTLDLHYLVFCMALAEGLASLYELSVEQRQMLNESAKAVASKFNRRTLRLARLSQSSCSSSPSSRTYMDALENTRVDCEDVPSKEKQDLLDAIQSLASRVQHGFKLAQRIAMVFRSAMYLDKEYLDVLKTKDPYILLNSAANGDCMNRLLVMSDIMTSMHLNRNEIAEFMSEQIAKSIIKSRFYLFQNSMTEAYGQNFLWGYDLDKELHLFLELCPNTTILGNYLLRYCDVLKIYRKFDSTKQTEPEINATEQNIPEMRKVFNNLRQIMESQVLSHKKQNMITVELLIKAHDCYVHECSMEGIANILHRCKNMANTLTTAKSWHLIVRMLMGVGRYRDMYYCFEKLIDNEQFESLLGQFDEERAIGLKEAVIKYLGEHYPADREKYRLAALHFQMYQELAQMSETEAQQTLIAVVNMNEKKTIQSLTHDEELLPALNRSAEALTNGLSAFTKAGASYMTSRQQGIDQLLGAMDNYAHAAENHLLNNKLGLAQKAAAMAELIALQINLKRTAIEDNKTTCICVLNVKKEVTFRYVVAYELSVPQALILSRGYPYEINWSEAIFNQYILQGRDEYIVDYCARMELTEDMIELIVKSFVQRPATMVLPSPVPDIEERLSVIVDMVETVTLRYKLASVLSDKRIIGKLLNDESASYLRDTNYGRNEIPL